MLSFTPKPKAETRQPNFNMDTIKLWTCDTYAYTKTSSYEQLDFAYLHNNNLLCILDLNE